MIAAAEPALSGLAPADEVGARSRPSRFAWATLAIAGIVLFSWLGVWQLERRLWKLDLIARVEQRVHAPPVAAPGRASWSRIDARADEYRHVVAKGHFLDRSPALVQAVTARGGGYWVIAPLTTDDGDVVLVNRGFVPVDRAAWPDLAPPHGEIEVTGLLRLSEPGGAFLRHNDPTADRWYARDVAAIAQSRGLRHVAPYFIDAEAQPDEPARLPAGGLTVVVFPNNHAVYALTWFALAAMSSYGLIRGVWLTWRPGRRAPEHNGLERTGPERRRAN